MADGLTGALAVYCVGEKVQIHAFRRDELLMLEATLQADDVLAYTLALAAKSKAVLAAARPSLIGLKKTRKPLAD